MKIETHGVEIEVEDGTEVVGIAQTTSGTVLFLKNRNDVYAVYSPVKSKVPHIHFPLDFIKSYDDGVLEFVDYIKIDAKGLEGLKKVFTDISACVKSANCYFDRIDKQLRSSMPVISWLNKKKYEECMKKYNDDDLCSVYKGAPIRLMGIVHFWTDSTTTPLEPEK